MRMRLPGFLRRLVKMQISYKPGTGLLYRLNPLIKGFVTFALILFFSLNRISTGEMALSLLGLLCGAAFFKVPLREIVFSIRRISVLLVIVGLVQGFRGDTFSILLAAEGMIRIVGVFLAAGIYLTVSSQSELMYFWEICFRPLRLLGLPARELALVMVIAVRFLPVILAEIDRIRMAQIARGAKLNSGGLFASAASLMPLMIPTLTQAIIRAGELAEAMEARGYRVASERTRYHRFDISTADITLTMLTILALVLSMLFRMN